jgi:histone deacetylase complex regulatory component SIN3
MCLYVQGFNTFLPEGYRLEADGVLSVDFPAGSKLPTNCFQPPSARPPQQGPEHQVRPPVENETCGRNAEIALAETSCARGGRMGV